MLDFIVRFFVPLTRCLLSTPDHQGRLRRQRRLTLWLAVHGVDVGPRVIHGVAVVR
jgi:hypothetical protein